MILKQGHAVIIKIYLYDVVSEYINVSVKTSMVFISVPMIIHARTFALISSVRIRSPLRDAVRFKVMK